MMNYFEGHMFNPNYVNEIYYRQLQAAQYTADQNERVIKTVHAFNDMLNQVDGLDADHQKQAFDMCVCELARRMMWKQT